MQLCDLHVHSNYSDGTLTPAQIVREAQTLGLSAVALTDHNTVAGLSDFLRAAEGTSLEAVPGIEFSTDYLDVELHILGLFVQERHYDAITRITDEMQQRKMQSNLDLIAALNQAGYAVDYHKIKASMPAGEPNRALIAAELTHLGYTPDIQSAFKTLLGAKCGYYHPPKRIDVFELIEFLRSIGTVPVLAYPFLNLKEPEALRKFLAPAKECGLVGMEVLYSKFTRSQTAEAMSIADEFGLLYSGGSDFHGENKPDIRLGTGRGDLQIPLRYLEALQNHLSSKFL